VLDMYTQPDGTVPGHDAVYVGDVKLSDFRASFAKSNFNVQFDQGTRTFSRIAIS
jgi:hypothetical protein